MKHLLFFGTIISSILLGQVDKSMDLCSRQNSFAKWLSIENMMTENQERINITFYDLYFKIFPDDQ